MTAKNGTVAPVTHRLASGWLGGHPSPNEALSRRLGVALTLAEAMTEELGRQAGVLAHVIDDAQTALVYASDRRAAEALKRLLRRCTATANRAERVATRLARMKLS